MTHFYYMTSGKIFAIDKYFVLLNLKIEKALSNKLFSNIKSLLKKILLIKY